MIKGISLLAVVWILALPLKAQSQLVSPMEDESKLYAQAKQVNQFFRRFNGEEDEKGNRYYPGDRQYQNVKLRKKYLSILFDQSNTGIDVALKVEFAKYILDKSEPAILNFHD